MVLIRFYPNPYEFRHYFMPRFTISSATKEATSSA